MGDLEKWSELPPVAQETESSAPAPYVNPPEVQDAIKRYEAQVAILRALEAETPPDINIFDLENSND